MDRTRRSPLRFLAPIALVAFGLALLLVVSSADLSDDGGSGGASEEAEQRDLGSDRSERRRERDAETTPTRQPAKYVVKEGDTLGSIAEETGVPVEELQELNPELDPQALVTGQEVRLRE
jgi:LysM repeat protein